MRQWILWVNLALAIGSLLAKADVGVDAVISAGQQARLEEDPDTDSGHSVAPVLGYEPVFKFVYGVAYFYNEPTASLGVDVNTNFAKVYQFHATVSHRFSPKWEYGLRSGLTKGYEPYYGEGGDTKPENFVRLWGYNSKNRLYLAYKPSSVWSFGVYSEVRYRTEEYGELSPPSRLFPNETSVAVGLFQKIDTRKLKSKPKDGFVFGTTVSHVAPQLTNVTGIDGFTQIEGEFIVYKEILTDAIPDVIAAFQVMAGHSFSRPSYGFTYRLGGSDTLRGYLENRFRGSKYYLQQTELRFPILQPVSGAAFMAFGDATNGTFGDAKRSYGFGIHIGLPPDYINQIRIDVGYGKDQDGVFADFGYVF